MTKLAATMCAAALAFALGCGDDDEEIVRFAIEPRFLQFADTLSTAGSDTVWVGAQVGFLGCTLENARLDRRGDSLVVAGNARCVVRRCRACPSLGMPRAPEQPHAEIIPFPVPQLVPGTYSLVAGTLVDTVVVAAQPVSPPVRIAALGSFVTPWLPCPAAATVFFVDLHPDVSLIYETVAADAPPQSGYARVSAFRSDPQCAGGVAGRLRLRWIDRVATQDATGRRGVWPPRIIADGG